MCVCVCVCVCVCDATIPLAHKVLGVTIGAIGRCHLYCGKVYAGGSGAVATTQSDGFYHLHGYKWFTSATDGRH